MKIIHLIDYFQPKLGYQETFLAKEQQKLGHNVTVVTSDRYYPFSNYDKVFHNVLGNRICRDGMFIEENIKVFRLKSFEIRKTPLIYLFDLENTLRKQEPDVVICHNMYSFTSVMASQIKRKIGFKLIYDTHTADFNTNLSNSFFKRIYHFIFHKFGIPLIKKNADAVFAIGEDERDYICRDFQYDCKTIPVIRLGVDTKQFKFSKNLRSIQRDKLKVKNDEILLVFSGKVLPEKKLELLFQAIKLIDDPKIRLLVIGDGDKEYIDRLKNINTKGVIWRGFVENKYLSDFFSSSDIAVWPGTPAITMLEAMACKLPLIIPNRLGTQYLSESGAVLRFENYKDLAEKIKSLAYNITLRKKVGFKAEQYIENYHKWDAINIQLMKLIQNI